MGACQNRAVPTPGPRTPLSSGARLRCAAALIACQLAVLAGCGDARTVVAGFTRSAAPDGFRTLTFPASGVSFRAPRSWSVASEASPLVTVVSSGAAVVAVWRYPKTGPPPSAAASLAKARAALVAASRARDRGLRLLDSRPTSVDGAPAIELDAVEQIAGQPRRVRSTHAFTDRAEIVFEEYAPVNAFPSLDRAVFSPLGRSVRLFAAR